MSVRAACCQGTNLRAWITLVVLIQCALILLYWDATRSATGPSKSFRLQAKASRDHLRSQGGSDVPEVALGPGFRQRHSHGETEAPARKTVDGTRDGNFERVDVAPDRKLTFSEDHVTTSKREVVQGRLISPETELLLYRRPKKRKHSGLSDGTDTLDNEMMQRQEVVQFTDDEKRDKASNNKNDSVHRSYPERNESKTAENQTEARHKTVNSSLVSDGNRTSTSSRPTENNVFTSTLRTGALNSTNIEIHVGTSSVGLIGLGKSSTPNIHSLNKMYDNYKKYEMKRIRLSRPESIENGTLKIPLGDIAGGAVDNRTLPGTARATMPETGTKNINIYSSSTKQLFKSDFGNEVRSQAPTTPGMRLSALRREYRLRPKPIFDKPVPKDPYSFTSSKPLYQIGTKEEFQRATPDLPAVFHLPQGEIIEDRYFVKNGGESCFRKGTAIRYGPDELEKSYHTGCLCKRGWHGHQCSIPESVFSSTGARFVELLKPRNTARRVISALAFNVEFELLEARLHELDSVIDVFIILESNYTNYGDPKPLHLLQKLRDGYLKEFHHKIVYLFRGMIPQGGRDDGWLVDQHMRMFIGQEGMRKVTNAAPDDIFLYTDADEIPNRQSILFLRMHDGYSEPFGVSLRWSVFGFFWKQIEPTRVLIGCTVGMFRYVFNNDAYQLRSTDYQNQASDRLHAYIASGRHIYDWHMGDNGVLSGWHCSWCLPPSRIRIKLTSAINADFPRWGDFPEKLEIPYLRNLVKTGTWFDDKTRFGMLVTRESEEGFAPQYMLNHSSKFPYLLDLEDV